MLLDLPKNKLLLLPQLREFKTLAKQFELKLYLYKISPSHVNEPKFNVLFFFSAVYSHNEF